MECSIVTFDTPYIWAVFSAVFLGAALSRMTMRPHPVYDPDRARSIKWALVCIYLTVTVGFAMLGIFVPGPEKIVDIRLLFFFIGATVFSFLGFRFKRLFGIVFAISLIIAFFLLYGFLGYWKCIPNNGVIGEFRAIREKDSAIEFVTYFDQTPSFLTVEGKRVNVAALSLEIEEYYLLGTGSTFYQLYEITGTTEERPPGGMAPHEETGTIVPSYSSLQENKWYTFLSNFLLRLPGIAAQWIESEYFRPVLFQKYAIKYSGVSDDDREEKLIIEPVVE